MSETPFDPSRPTVLQAADVRRTPVLGAAVGCAAAASILGWIERGPIATAIVVALWLVAVLLLLAVTPQANTLRLDRDGFRIRAFGVFSRFVPWSAVREVETGDGWAGGSLIVDLDETANQGLIVGLPHDAELVRRSFADHYGLDAEELATLMVRWRTLGSARP